MLPLGTVSRSRQTRSRIAVTASWLVLSLLAAVLVPSGSARAPRVAKGGGTLRVAIYEDPGTIEPGTTVSQQAVQLMYATQLSLVTYREDGRPGTGRRIIPYGAAQMPTLSDDGKTYRFRIRPGLKFSDASPVTARSFQVGFERVLNPRMRGQGGGGGGAFANVVGAPAFIQGQADHVSGVKATKDRLIFHLAAVEPDFLSRLTRPLVSAMPLNLPIVPGGYPGPLASAGPYFVQEYVPGRTLRLLRNPHWKRSTLRSRPANFKEIDYVERATAADAVAAVRNGDADVATVLDPTALSPDLIRELKRRYGVNRRQFWAQPMNYRSQLVFNTRHPPFDNARLRRAVAFALDREVLLKKLGGPLAGRVTDQLLLPIGAGFRDWKLYPSRPDLDRATRLAHGALQGTDATLIVDSTGSGPGVGAVIKSNLDRIGLHVEVMPKAPLVFRDYLKKNPDSWDLATMYTSPYHVDPVVYINLGLEGHTYDQPPSAEGCACVYNYSGFDDPKWVGRMQRTNSLRHGRLNAYARLDRDLMRWPVPIAPFATGNSLTLVSSRIGCFSSSAYPGLLRPQPRGAVPPLGAVSRSRQTRSSIAVTASLLGLSLLAAVLVPSGSARAPSVAKSGGTLRVAIYEDPLTIEPATRATKQAIALMYATQLSLVTYREDWGPGTGRRIIPYGAEMPTLSDDGKTYTFRIRSGLRFSDGKLVTGHSFRAGFERALDPMMRAQGGWLFENVVGALAFSRGQAAYVSGLRATKDRLIVRLYEAEPDFLSRLAMPIVSAMPLNLPIVPNGVPAPLVSAGPYYVQEYVSGRMLQLLRNRYWKPATLLSRPANFKEIDYVERATAADAVAAVRRDEADVATVLDPTALSPDLIRELKRRYGGPRRQFWARPMNYRSQLVFNTRHGPFNNARLRRAVAFALDREVLLKKLGPLAGQVTDQLLLQISAGFRDWKLYPPRPDLTRAKRLAHGALQGKDATLIVDSTGSGPEVGAVIKSNLAQIGLHVEVMPKAPLVFRDYLKKNPDSSGPRHDVHQPKPRRSDGLHQFRARGPQLRFAQPHPRAMCLHLQLRRFQPPEVGQTHAAHE